MSNSNQVEFMERHLPALKTGSYELAAAHTLTTSGGANNVTSDNVFSSAQRFAISGPRYTLDSSLIYAAFPPPNSLGDHANTVPHLAFYRSTLPWERSGDPEDENLPWLALLTFTDAEARTIATVPARKADVASLNPAYGPLEPWDAGDDPVTLIELDLELLNRVVPAAAEMKLSAHARKEVDAAGKLVGEEPAIVVSNRLPTPGGSSTVYLVSLENHYANGAFVYAGQAGTVRLVSLYTWSFACSDPQQSFRGLLKNLDGAAAGAPAELRLPDATGGDASANAAANGFVRRGYVPLNHSWREGGTLVSWYHGPFIPGFRQLHNVASGSTLSVAEAWAQTPYQLARTYGFNLPAASADGLTRYQPDTTLLDVSYAAAWELGRLLALQDKTFSVGLYNWKKSVIRALKNQPHASLRSYLPIYGGTVPEDYKLPEYQRNWLIGLSRGEGVPFNYLVPHASMLPLESIRFFKTDPVWLACLIDGAFSMGRSLPSDLRNESESCVSSIPAFNYEVSGFLLRSQVVSGWPTLIVTGFGADDGELPILRQAQLGENVLLCLFSGDLRSAKISQKPEGINFGLDEDPDRHAAGDPIPYYMELRPLDGSGSSGSASNPVLAIEAKHFRGGDIAGRVLDLNQLGSDMARILTGSAQTTLNSAQFGLELVAGVEAVIFNEGKP